ncbi:glycoside hydrolase family 2 TIM barrel-domain containing protein [Christiangramia forsetii]|nr:glycoside hydrolase family 2 TIM barrel-domain containing protein [Christiangramia forsetii]GGG40123.1 beta-galactosidase [Christiangramia forsetii]
MNNKKLKNIAISKLYAFILILSFLGNSSYSQEHRKMVAEREIDFNQDWQFSLREISDSSRTHHEANWKKLQLPHDWSVEASFDSINGEGATGYLPGGIGWYKKEFKTKVTKDEKTYLYFDGVYNNAEIWLNGNKLGFHPYGYSPFYFDITAYLKKDSINNLLMLKVDRTRYVDSRWYTGSGIYRDVKLITTDKLHIPVWGTFFTTSKISEKEATINAEISLINDHSENMDFQLITEIYNPQDKIVASISENISLKGNSEKPIVQELKVDDPLLWDINTPNMYTAITTIKSNDKNIDHYKTSFGIRSFRFDKDNGFFLNGKSMKIKGVNLHHDAGLVGAAVPRGVWKRRLLKLKEAGVNAIRTAHNPASEDFLDLCDEMGFLIQEEFFDEWGFSKDKRLNQQERHSDYISRGYTEHFQKWAEKDLKNTMLRDRNHPSIIQWSIGNEIEWTYPRYSHSSGFFNMDWQGNYFWEQPPISPEEIKKLYNESPENEYVLAETAKKLSNWTKEMDTTRPVTANLILPSVSHVSGYTDALDVVGYSYRRVMYDYGHKNYPDKPIMGTENLVQWHEWKAVMERPFIAGTFLWTGIDYMGESNAQWPRKGTTSGMLDFAGFKKPSYHMIKTLWNDEPHIYIATQKAEKSIFRYDKNKGDVVEKEPGAWKQALWTWHDVNEHWNYSANDTVIVEIYSNLEEVELFLNDKSLGSKKLDQFDDRIYKWVVPFTDGTLIAKGTKNGKIVSIQRTTAGPPVAIELSTKNNSIAANSRDVAHIVAQLIDDSGNPVKTQEKKIEFTIEGEAKILGVDNGAGDNVQDYQSNSIITDQGRALLIIQGTNQPSTIKVNVKAPGLKKETTSIKISSTHNQK